MSKTVGLSGITVVDLTQGVSGPFATRLLSQMGARIIKVERPGSGDLIRFWDTIVHGMCSGHACRRSMGCGPRTSASID